MSCVTVSFLHLRTLPQGSGVSTKTRCFQILSSHRVAPIAHCAHSTTFVVPPSPPHQELIERERKREKERERERKRKRGRDKGRERERKRKRGREEERKREREKERRETKTFTPLSSWFLVTVVRETVVRVALARQSSLLGEVRSSWKLCIRHDVSLDFGGEGFRH